MSIMENFFYYLEDKLELTGNYNFFSDFQSGTHKVEEFAILEFLGENSKYNYSIREVYNFQFSYFAKNRDNVANTLESYRSILKSLGRFQLANGKVIQDLELASSKIDKVKLNASAYYQGIFEINLYF